MVQCRQTLMCTYVFAYYLRKNNQSLIFEANQKDLESATEKLSEYLERDITSENLADIKQKVQDKYRYVFAQLISAWFHFRNSPISLTIMNLTIDLQILWKTSKGITRSCARRIWKWLVDLYRMNSIRSKQINLHCEIATGISAEVRDRGRSFTFCFISISNKCLASMLYYYFLQFVSHKC